MTYANTTPAQREAEAMLDAIMMGTADVAALLASKRFNANQKACIEFADRASRTRSTSAADKLSSAWGVALDRISADAADASEMTCELVTMADACVETALMHH
ncbi:MAG: hypothetical protein JSR83_15865 [Proteobacteria bacterium]|nr:hypothetical protein [Pseudomonadota bacterium]